MTWTTRPRSEFGTLAAIAAGEGPLVVLLHGVGLRAEAWNAQIDGLTGAGFRVIAPDMPGHGQTPYAGQSDLGDYVTPLAALMTEPAIVIGHSMGAVLALWLAAVHRRLIRGVGPLNAIYQRDGAAQQAVQTRAATLDGITRADPTATLSRWFADTPSPERAACADWLNDVTPAGYRAAYNAFANSNGPATSLLNGLSCPSLFITGADEPNSTPAMSHAMATAAPQGQAHIIAGAAHMMPMTHADELNALLIPFATECLT
ncbi:MAG: alpha/beta fold hydrolase [Paracoccaceae bacterium]